ncbi:hypothetical protein N7528_010249 [Penicillium herquei]|nr:hypothetical protein N7528_010249 [Penicillium herquei]
MTALNEAVSLHLDCSSRKGGELTNPYLDASKSFHITFYEIVSLKRLMLREADFISGYLETEKIWEQETWKKGHLYINPGSSRWTKAPIFRRSAFTILVATENLTSKNEKARCPDLSPEWGTMLVLCPSITSSSGDFFMNERTSETCISSKWKTILEYNKVRVGEVAIIKEEYGILPRRWSRLLDHINSLLQEDFMDPESYIKLIFDDDQLSTSKK